MKKYFFILLLLIVLESIANGAFAEKVIKNITLPNGGLGTLIKADPVSNKVYLTFDKSVYTTNFGVINGNTDSIEYTAMIGSYGPEGNGPGPIIVFERGIAVNPDSNLIYLTKTVAPDVLPSPEEVSYSIIVINGSSKKIINEIEAGRPSILEFEPDTKRLYVVNTTINPATTVSPPTREYSISIIDTTTNEVIGSTKNFESFINSLALNTASKKIYASTGLIISGEGIYVIDTETKELLSTTNGVGLVTDIEFNPNTNKLYAYSNSTGLTDNPKIYVIDAGSNSIIKTINLFGNLSPDDIEINTDTNRIYVTHFTGKLIYVIDGTTDEVVSLIKVIKEPMGLTVNPLANRLYSIVNYHFIPVIDVSPETFHNNPLLDNLISSLNSIYLPVADLALSVPKDSDAIRKILEKFHQRLAFPEKACTRSLSRYLIKLETSMNILSSKICGEGDLSNCIAQGIFDAVKTNHIKVKELSSRDDNSDGIIDVCEK